MCIVHYTIMIINNQISYSYRFIIFLSIINLLIHIPEHCNIVLLFVCLHIVDDFSCFLKTKQFSLFKSSYDYLHFNKM